MPRTETSTPREHVNELKKKKIMEQERLNKLMSAMGRCLDSVEADIKKSAPIVLDLRNSPGLDSRTVRDRICFMKNILREMQEAAGCVPSQEKETRLASSIREPQKIDFHKMDKDAIQDENTYLENASVQEFIAQNEANGF